MLGEVRSIRNDRLTAAALTTTIYNGKFPGKIESIVRWMLKGSLIVEYSSQLAPDLIRSLFYSLFPLFPQVQRLGAAKEKRFAGLFLQRQLRYLKAQCSNASE